MTDALVEARPSVDFDPLDQRWKFDDHLIYDAIRDAGGIAWSSLHGGFWATPDHALCQQVTSDGALFRSGDGVRIPPSGLPPVFALEYDEPRHATHKVILSAAVGPRANPALDQMIRGRVRRLLADAADGALDLGEQFAFRFPVDVLFDVIGAPESMKRDVEEIAGAIFIYRTPLADGSDPAQKLKRLLGEMIAEVRAAPREDWLTSIVARTCPHSETLSDQEVTGAILALFVGGHHTTVRVGSCLLAQIVEDADLQAQLRADPSLIPQAVDEAVRMFVPLGWFARTASRDVRVGPAKVAAGERVMVMYRGANYDPKMFDDPTVFKLDRPRGTPHLGFGWGPHRCVGMALAQKELTLAVEELFAATKWISLRAPVNRTANSEARNIPCTLEP